MKRKRKEKTFLTILTNIFVGGIGEGASGALLALPHLAVIPFPTFSISSVFNPISLIIIKN
jgi:hypothetical protein